MRPYQSLFEKKASVSDHLVKMASEADKSQKDYRKFLQKELPINGKKWDQPRIEYARARGTSPADPLGNKARMEFLQKLLNNADWRNDLSDQDKLNIEKIIAGAPEYPQVQTRILKLIKTE